MRNSKLDQICAKRLQSKDFAQKEAHQPLLTKTETFAVAILLLMVAIALVYLAATTY